MNKVVALPRPVSCDSELLRLFESELDTAVTAEQRGQKVYRSLQQLSQLIGGEYGDRVLYELIQDAHEAHAEGTSGEVACVSGRGLDHDRQGVHHSN